MTRIAQLILCTLCVACLFACKPDTPKQPATPTPTAPTKTPATPKTAADPAKPTDPAKATDPAKPTEPAKPAEAKASPSNDLFPDPDFKLKSGEGFQLGGKKKGGLLGSGGDEPKKGPSLLNDKLQ